MVLCLLVLLTLAGFAGCVIAWRGRRINDHPLCRRCGFDLTGRPEGNIVCGECGADLTAAKAIRIGHRRAAGGWLAISLIVLLIGSAGGGLDAVRVSRATTWIQWMPVEYLLWKAQGSDPAAGKQALTELHRRATSSLLSDRQWASMIDVGLTCQGNRSLTWDPIWGDLIELGRQQGRVDDPRWTRYVAQGMAGIFALRTRPKVRVGDPLPFRVDTRGGRVAAFSNLQMKITFTRQEVAGQPVKCYFGSSTSSMNGSGSTGTLVRADELPTAVGSVNFAVVVHCVAGEPVNNYSSVVPRVAADLSLTSVFELVPSSQATVKPLHDPTQTKVMQQAIRARLTMTSDGRIDTMVDLKSTPVPLSYEVMLIVQGKETTVGHLSCPAVIGNSSWGIGGSAFIKPPSTATTKKAGDTVDVATVVFRPDPAEAIDTTDVTDYWDGTIELDQVPIVKGWH